MSLPLAVLPEAPRFRSLGPHHVDEVAARYAPRADLMEAVRVISQVLPFRVNEYVLSHLIDWARVPNDPIFQLVFPQRGMLAEDDERELADLLRAKDKRGLRLAVERVRGGLNPHPAGQKELNVPMLDGEVLPGVQHKYRETALYFPQQGQTCHAYCTYCFRWAQFVGDADLRFAAPGPELLVRYLRQHPAVTDVLVTGGDPMIMSTERLRSHLEPLLAVDTVRTIRIGTKSVAYWPHRFTTDPDADEVLRLFERVVASGRSLAVMAHFSHPRELETDQARAALARIRATGAVVYCQAPLIKHVNDDSRVWADMWRGELSAGLVPYYMFVERDTGPREYFKVPLARAVDIFQGAYRTLPGLARTVRGPSMSATPGKVLVDGVEDAPDGKHFRLRMVQARVPELVGRPFRARFSETASWLNELEIDPSTPADLLAAVTSAVPKSAPQTAALG
ncbi:lysine 2,3-aminomutase [Actinosynnema pretiosum subsp. pretiosum]|uniref:L-lysine 2,3-aminomutase n=2 Tax=Actinosynnema TaxID=40566 RepID=C6WNV8_ACTMD|nr:lysine 2,3-aminomutase [Actinosynnema mirum]ACU36627.1 L-lysine 2,3-aminomutase [Actinosynnema mirum DSM 43827]AXX30080.1 Lysine 2,3-aminomutase [Actinosynnema pretiosum subsp. pretiosum]QUF05747.1 lysine 2,3-aminomutase [Actinosynnema pretiosum subsp. pretiosum]